MPNIALVAFKKVYKMADGETRRVSLRVEAEERVVVTNETFIRTVEPQPLRIWVGNGQPVQQLHHNQQGSTTTSKYVSGTSGVHQATVQVTGVATPLKAC
eukprot:COSAG02_NODE_2536_length_8579_cov_4.816863_9_plen_100_part_00